MQGIIDCKYRHQGIVFFRRVLLLIGQLSCSHIIIGKTMNYLGFGLNCHVSILFR